MRLPNINRNNLTPIFDWQNDKHVFFTLANATKALKAPPPRPEPPVIQETPKGDGAVEIYAPPEPSAPHSRFLESYV
jgi:hypothetical protein